MQWNHHADEIYVKGAYELIITLWIVWEIIAFYKYTPLTYNDND